MRKCGSERTCKVVRLAVAPLEATTKAICLGRQTKTRCGGPIMQRNVRDLRIPTNPKHRIRVLNTTPAGASQKHLMGVRPMSPLCATVPEV